MDEAIKSNKWNSTLYCDVFGQVEVFARPFGVDVICQCVGENAIEHSKLISAAPELLAALEAWEKAMPRLDEFASVSPDSLRGKALAAIAKAKGTA